MTAQRDFDRLLTAWLEADAPARAPVALADAAIAGVARTARRPAWRIPERWIQMQLSARFLLLPRLAPALVIVALVVAAILAVFLIGSRPKVPSIDGPARPGAVVFETAGHQIAISGVDGSGTRLLSIGDGKDASPAWSRDGTEIAFFSVPKSGTSAKLIVVAPDGANRRILADGLPMTADGVPLVNPPTWALDGSAIAYIRIQGQSEEIDVVSLDGSAPRSLVRGAPLGANPVWKPDGSALAYCGSPDGVERAVYLVAADGEGLPQRLSAAVPSNLICPDIAWSGDGRQLAFRRGSDDGPFGGVRIWIINSDGSNEHRLTTSHEVEMNPVWSPAGDRIAFGRRFGQTADGIPTFKLVIVDLDGSHEVTISGIAPLLYASWEWSPDGAQLLVQTASGGAYLVDPAGIKAPVSVPSWGDWQRLAQ